MKFKLWIAALAVTWGAHAAQDTTQWSFPAIYGVSFNQTVLRQWNAGGQNNLAAGAILRQQAIAERGSWRWEQLLDAAYSLNIQEGVARKIDDKLEYATRFDYLLREDPLWKLSGFTSFKTQFVKGFAKPGDTVYVSRAFAPAYGIAGIGLTHKNDGFELYASPVTAKFTWVLDSALSAQGVFGLQPGQRYRQELGLYGNARFQKSFKGGIKIDLRLNAFANYLQAPFSIDVDSDLLLVYKNKGPLSVTLRSQNLFDRDVLLRDTNGDGKLDASGIQTKQFMGLGLTYEFGKKK
ncbi:MAG: DUF3078 domain-containing protein [Schleiferiaceae bacterium]